MRPRLADCVAKLRHFDGRRMKNLSPEQFEQRKQEFEKHRKELEELLTVKFGYGRLSWAIDGATNDPATVGNWWELLRTWYNPQ